MDAARDLLVEQDVLHRRRDVGVDADRELADVAGTLVRVEDLVAKRAQQGLVIQGLLAEVEHARELHGPQESIVWPAIERNRAAGLGHAQELAVGDREDACGQIAGQLSG